VGWNGHQRQWDRQRNDYGRNADQHQWQQPADGGQLNNPGSYNRASYPIRSQSPDRGSRSSSYSHNPTSPGGQTGAQPSFRQPDASGSTPLPQGQSSEGAI
jgi:hypothetical protein